MPVIKQKKNDIASSPPNHTPSKKTNINLTTNKHETKKNSSNKLSCKAAGLSYPPPRKNLPSYSPPHKLSPQ